MFEDAVKESGFPQAFDPMVSAKTLPFSRPLKPSARPLTWALTVVWSALGVTYCPSWEVEVMGCQKLSVYGQVGIVRLEKQMVTSNV